MGTTEEGANEKRNEKGANEKRNQEGKRSRARSGGNLKKDLRRATTRQDPENGGGRLNEEDVRRP